ncbi:3-hydroxyacyl-CoA dehydrogenase type-2 Scu [Gordonia polyisoprenivorans VH2]|uniref:3-hydroxyacyl-CoA dehydrogenase type-2 Scu n=1 Tax=Gordonia polyisoprenivorans (strain DSM 44266 / VH2) TaxID=1112204 RepID=H6N3S8_GORPV|nr:SDR family NAD(P)-dependent oxidoreductase [Gordonia polyisoprenivorans]AFA73549.1 3-hydroxyacyl-CoA dehydrogenase type-2 Scu [Gordonia polyisoprenivorans VH2]
MQLTDVSTLVTGGGSGLGLATARALRDRGANVVIVDLPTSPGETVAADIGARYVPADITDEAQLSAAFDAAEENGPLRGIVHCAGRGGDRLRIIGKDRTPAPLNSFEDVIRVNLFGTYNVLRLGAQRIAGNEPLDGDRGAIVLTASVAAFDGQIGQTSYTAAKAAVHGITLVAARDLATWAIRVNTIAPGTFETPMLGRLRDDIREGLAASVPHPRRLGKPEEYGRLAVEMLENSYLNGQTVRLDGAIRMAPR